MERNQRRAIVTGASSGIGAATAQALYEAGFDLTLVARRRERLERLAEPLGAKAVELDVTQPDKVETFASKITDLDLLVNNAGGALGLEPVAESVDQRWLEMFQVNVLAVARLTRLLLPKLIASGDGHIINVGSIAGFETYPGGAGYTAAKHGLRALTRTLRLELLGRPVRVTEVCPGMVETEFSLVRFYGDEERAKAVYQGMEPLRAEDVADCIVWVATRPSHVNIDEIVVRPRDQAAATQVYRR